jgi:hypothetical protein
MLEQLRLLPKTLSSERLELPIAQLLQWYKCHQTGEYDGAEFAAKQRDLQQMHSLNSGCVA